MSTVSIGSRWRKKVQDYLTSLGYRTTFTEWGQAGDDITARGHGHVLSVEVKHHARLAVPAFIDQAVRQAPIGHVPIVVAHRRGKSSVEDAFVIMTGAAFASLITTTDPRQPCRPTR